MNNKKMYEFFDKRFRFICLIGGFLILSIVFMLSRRADLINCKQKLTTMIEFVKKQSSSYIRNNDTAIAKSLVRDTTAAHMLEDCQLDCDEKELEDYVNKLWLTGITLLDKNGNIICEYTEDDIGYSDLLSDIKKESVLSVIGYPKKLTLSVLGLRTDPMLMQLLTAALMVRAWLLYIVIQKQHLPKELICRYRIF